jgi:hypothetical protein
VSAEGARPRPYTLVAELTYRCPLRCVYCSNPLDWARRRDELDTDTWLRVLREAEALGVVQVNLSGGEPLVRDDLEAIVAGARGLDLYTNLITSGIPSPGPGSSGCGTRASTASRSRSRTSAPTPPIASPGSDRSRGSSRWPGGSRRSGCR